MKKMVSKKPQSVDEKIDELARMMANGFSSLQDSLTSLQQNVASIKTTLVTKADRADILNLHDKFIHRREFDELSLRVSKIEAKIRK